MTFTEYIELNGFAFTDAIVPEIKEVRTEAAEHVYRIPFNDLNDKKRPLENETIKAWRRANKRYITHEIVDTALSECQTNIEQNGFYLLKQGDILKDWLETARFKYLFSDVSFFEYYLKCILPEAIADPNGYLFILPNDPNSPNPPSEAPAFNQVGIELKLIPSEKIKHTLDSDIFVIWGGEVTVEKQKLPWYWTGDKNAIYKAIPTKYVDRKWVYEFKLWYQHDLDRVPLVIFPGKISKNEKGQIYQESLFRSAFPYLDEFVTACSDNQWMRNKNAYPTLVLPTVNCSKCNGEKYMQVGDDRLPCTTCDGTGKLRAPGISEFLMLPTADGLDGKNETRNPFWLSPDIGSLDHSWTTTWDLLDKAAATLGINPLIKNAESGEAMKMRLEKLSKTVNMVYQSSIQFLTDGLEIIEGLLVVNPADRVDPVIKKHHNILLRNLDFVKAMIDTALPIEKKGSVMDYLSIKYQNDPVDLLKYQVLANYYETSILKTEEVRDLIAFEVITQAEHKRDRMAVSAIDEVIETVPDFLALSKRQIYDKVEEILNQQFRDVINNG